jgi:hypothetical protein
MALEAWERHCAVKYCRRESAKGQADHMKALYCQCPNNTDGHTGKTGRQQRDNDGHSRVRLLWSENPP